MMHASLSFEQKLHSQEIFISKGACYASSIRFISSGFVKIVLEVRQYETLRGNIILNVDECEVKAHWPNRYELSIEPFCRVQYDFCY